jgi:CO/xanthine dehydrogenase Mo-binding subunit
MRVVAPDVGGSFGGKGSLYHEEMLVCLLARKLERPVKYVADRLEELSSSSQAFDQLIDAELAVARDGTFLGLRCDVIGDIGAYSIYPWTGGIEPVQVISFMPGPYKIEHYHGRVRAVLTPKPPTAWCKKSAPWAGRRKLSKPMWALRLTSSACFKAWTKRWGRWAVWSTTQGCWMCLRGLTPPRGSAWSA